MNNQVRCNRCAQKPKPGTEVWLEADRKTGKFYSGGVPINRSQGCFLFCRYCTSKVDQGKWQEPVERRTNRKTGHKVALYVSDDQAIHADGKYAVSCEAHSSVVGSDTMREATRLMAHPDEWCDECKLLGTEER